MQVWLRAPVADMVRLREEGKLSLASLELSQKYKNIAEVVTIETSFL